MGLESCRVTLGKLSTSELICKVRLLIPPPQGCYKD